MGETKSLPTKAKSLPMEDRPSIWGLLRSLAHIALADVWSRVGWVNEAVRCYERALAAEPRQRWLYQHQVELLAGLERWEEAVVSARGMSGRSPEDAEAQRALGRCLVKVGRYEEALGAFEKAYALAPDGRDSGLWAVICLGRLGREAEALERLRELVRQHPDRKWPRTWGRMATKRSTSRARRIDWEREAERLESETPLFETPSEPPIL